MPDEFDDETRVPSMMVVQAPPTGRDRAYLIVLAGSSVGQMFKLSSESTIVGRSEDAEIRVIDDGVSRRHAELFVRGKDIIVRDLGSKNGTFCNGEAITEHKLQDGDKIQVGSTSILKFTFSDQLDESFQKQMFESALMDGLTKVYNKKYFLERLSAEFTYARRHKTKLSLLMIDIDHFKRINDTHGHLAGDHVLATLASDVASTIRGEDVFARYGGEEFAVICRGIDVEGSRIFAERIRARVDKLSFTVAGVAIHATVSLGVATLEADAMLEPSELIKAADDALYQAKRDGRNRVAVGVAPRGPSRVAGATATLRDPHKPR